MKFFKTMLAPATLVLMLAHGLEDVVLITIGAQIDPWWLRYGAGLGLSWLVFSGVLHLHGKEGKHG